MIKRARAKRRLPTKPALKKNKVAKRPVLRPERGLRSYEVALKSPFSELAEGARVPDLYSTNTTPMTFKREFTFVANAGGVGDFIIVPNLLIPVVSTQNNISGGDNWILSNRTIASGMVYIPPTTLASKLINYRIVSYGVRIRGTTSMTGSSGKAFFATIPVKSMVFSSGLASAPIGGYTPANGGGWNVSDSTVLNTWGIPYITQSGASYVDVPGLVRMPNHTEMSMLNLAESGLEIVPKICSPEAFDFRRTSDSTLGTDMIAQTSVTSVWSGDASYYHFGGHETVVFGVAGAPVGATLSVELVVHLEGQPQLTDSVGFVNEAPRSIANPMAMLESVTKAASSPTFRALFEGGLALASNLAKFAI